MLESFGKQNAKNAGSVNILDTIMSEAQRQGRLSFYMVSLVNNKSVSL